MKKFQDLTLADHFLFCEVMRDHEICRMFLSELLDKNIVFVEFSDKEKELSESFWGKGVRLDIEAIDNLGIKYDVELQNVSSGDLLKRCRFYQSVMDRNSLKSGQNYSELPDSYIIFVCTFDYFNQGFAKYDRISYMNSENIGYDDGSHVIFLNSKYVHSNVSKPVEEFLSIVNGLKLDAFDSQLAEGILDRITEVKANSEMENTFMTVGDLINQEVEIAKAEARAEAIAETKAEVLETLGLTEAQYEEILKQKEQEKRI